MPDTRSMTGYATHAGAGTGWRWVWEMRGVNGRGLDVRLRLPDTIDGLDQPLRKAVQDRIARGNVTLSLKLTRDEGAADVRLDRAALDRAVALLREVEDAAAEGELTLVHSTAADLLSLRGVLETGTAEADTDDLRQAVLGDLPALIDAFDAARAGEGAALETLIAGQIDRIEVLVAQAVGTLADREAAMAGTLKTNVAKLLDSRDGLDETRIAQELALLAVKSDVTEEIDRLGAHVAAARDLLAADGPKGRKLDFLTQEFNREANTLCSKAGFAPLTAIGLDLKTVIDQMREQVQNVE